MIGVIIQARISSTRLPGKAMIVVAGKTLLEHQVERLRCATSLDEIIVATSTAPEDDIIASFCDDLGVHCFRGSMDDVLARYHGAALEYNADIVVRVTSDCPLIDPVLIDRMVDFHIQGDYDYTALNMPPSWPHGLDAEAMRAKCLREAFEEATEPPEREHVTPFLRNNPSRYRLGNLRSPDDFTHHRWTVDWPEDLEFIRAVYDRLYVPGGFFSTADVLRLLDAEPHLVSINKNRNDRIAGGGSRNDMQS